MSSEFIFPEGNYKAKAIAARLAKSALKATPFVEISFEVSAPGEIYDRSVIAWQGYLTEKTGARTAESLRHAGFTGTDFKTGFPGLGTKNCTLVIAHEEYPEGSGKIRARVNFVNADSGGSDMTKAEAAVLDNAMAGFFKVADAKMSEYKAKMAPPGAGAQNAARRAHAKGASVQVADEDVPF